MEKCRYVPKLVNIDGEKDKIIKQVVAATKTSWSIRKVYIVKHLI